MIDHLTLELRDFASDIRAGRLTLPPHVQARYFERAANEIDRLCAEVKLMRSLEWKEYRMRHEHRMLPGDHCE